MDENTLYVIASTPAGARRPDPPVVQNAVQQMVEDYKATGNKNVDWCPVNYKDGTKRAQDGEWQKGW